MGVLSVDIDAPQIYCTTDSLGWRPVGLNAIRDPCTKKQHKVCTGYIVGEAQAPQAGAPAEAPSARQSVSLVAKSGSGKSNHNGEGSGSWSVLIGGANAFASSTSDGTGDQAVPLIWSCSAPSSLPETVTHCHRRSLPAPSLKAYAIVLCLCTCTCSCSAVSFCLSEFHVVITPCGSFMPQAWGWHHTAGRLSQPNEH